MNDFSNIYCLSLCVFLFCMATQNVKMTVLLYDVELGKKLQFLQFTKLFFLVIV